MPAREKFGLTSRCQTLGTGGGGTPPYHCYCWLLLSPELLSWQCAETVRQSWSLVMVATTLNCLTSLVFIAGAMVAVALAGIGRIVVALVIAMAIVVVVLGLIVIVALLIMIVLRSAALAGVAAVVVVVVVTMTVVTICASRTSGAILVILSTGDPPGCGATAFMATLASALIAGIATLLAIVP